MLWYEKWTPSTRPVQVAIRGGERAMQIQPYLFFDGRCEEAIEFYRRAVGAEVQMLMRFRDAPAEAKCEQMAPGTDSKVMHAALKIGDAQVLASDGRCQGKPSFQGFGLALN